VDSKMYLLLSLMMFLEYAVWGAWAPVLASRLLGPLKMSGKQTGWIYGTIPLACLVSPIVAGQMADQLVASKWILVFAHFAGAVLLYLASKKEKFGPLFIVMMAYSLLYAATMPLVNSLMFANLTDAATQSPKIFIWAPIGWVLVGLMLTGWRKSKGDGDGSDCLKFAAILSVLMGACCLFQPSVAPAGSGGSSLAFLDAFSMLKDSNILLFFIISFFVTTQLQFYFLCTAPFLGAIGAESKNVPALMAIAQAAQIGATVWVLPVLLGFGYKWTLAAGVLSWLILYLVYSVEKPKQLVYGSMIFHGIAYVTFIIGGQIYINSVADASIQSSAQALLFMATVGLGFFLGTQFTGVVMDKFSVDGKFQWRKIFIVPCGILLACALAFIIFFKA